MVFGLLGVNKYILRLWLCLQIDETIPNIFTLYTSSTNTSLYNLLKRCSFDVFCSFCSKSAKKKHVFFSPSTNVGTEETRNIPWLPIRSQGLTRPRHWKEQLELRWQFLFAVETITEVDAADTWWLPSMKKKQQPKNNDSVISFPILCIYI